MAKKVKNLDVWIVESNSVYRDVPYTVVIDWIQQGRLLGEDRVRAAGGGDWLAISKVSAFATFLPKFEAYRVEDQAEALEAVRVDFGWKKKTDDEEDVDMIPLIDISLVLLIFFMMTSAVGGAASLIDTPEAKYKLLAIDQELIWVGIKPGNNGTVYSCGKGDKVVEDDLTHDQVLARVDILIREQYNKARERNERVGVSIKADRKIPYDVVRDMTADLEQYRRNGMVGRIFAEVSEKEPR